MEIPFWFTSRWVTGAALPAIADMLAAGRQLATTSSVADNEEDQRQLVDVLCGGDGPGKR
ncbi:hypothetical protein ASC90_09365 [Rhizobium sp. Root1220]|nr:hypothetical protein ASC90_09365 [Rhizobium sp. Root1220]